MLYRLFTEDINRADIEELTANEFDGFTVYKATGYWQGTPEQSLIVEIVADTDKLDKVKRLAEAIKVNNHQQAVLVETIANHHYMI